MAQAATYVFNGNPIYSCTYSASLKLYTCPSSAYLAEYDQVIIADGYTVKVNNNIIIGYNHGLTMSGMAKLIVTGYLDISAMNPANLKVTDGSFEVGGTFTAGDLSTTISADVTAGAIQLGPARVTITGNLVSKGVVNISSNSKVTGNISGTVITTASTVSITGNITATTRVSLESATTVAGTVTAPVVNLLPSNTRITGDVTATTSVTWAAALLLMATSIPAAWCWKPRPPSSPAMPA